MRANTPLLVDSNPLVPFTAITNALFNTPMDTTTYAAVAVLPWSIAQNNKRAGVTETEFDPLDLSFLSSAWLRLLPCNDL
jgi:hypothetical protein